jgi:hypothetical protein
MSWSSAAPSVLSSESASPSAFLFIDESCEEAVTVAGGAAVGRKKVDAVALLRTGGRGENSPSPIAACSLQRAEDMTSGSIDHKVLPNCSDD